MNEDKILAAVKKNTAKESGVQQHKNRLNLLVTMILLPVLTFIATLLLPWPQPEGEYAGSRMFVVLPMIMLEFVAVLAVIVVATVVTAAKAKTGLLGIVGLIVLQGHLCAGALFLALYSLYA